MPAGESASPQAEENTPPPAGENMPPALPRFDVPALGAASAFAVLAASTATCTGSSAFTGDVGVSPGTAATGFNPSCTLSGALHAGDAVAAAARAAAIAASGSLAALACDHDLTGEDLGGQTLEPGVYCFDSSAALTGRLTLDGGGRTDAAWAFQIGSSMITATGSSVVMVGGASACDVFWNVGSSATLGTGTAFQGNVLATTSITLGTGSSVTGRALALNAAVTSVANQVGGCSNYPQGSGYPLASERDGLGIRSPMGGSRRYDEPGADQALPQTRRLITGELSVRAASAKRFRTYLQAAPRPLRGFSIRSTSSSGARHVT
jgi:hypothetical protein